MLVGNSLFDYLQSDKTDKGDTNETVNPESDNADKDDKTLFGNSSLDRTSTSTSRTSNDAEDSAKSGDSITPRRTGSRTLRPPSTMSLSGSGFEPGSQNPATARSMHRLSIRGRASISDFRPSNSQKKSSHSIREDLEEDEEALIKALRPPVSSAGAEIIDAADFMQDQPAHNHMDGYEGEIDSIIKEIRETNPKMSTNEKNSDSDGPPSDFDA